LDITGLGLAGSGSNPFGGDMFLEECAMSEGLAICSNCKREVHQDGPNHSWRHCEDKSPRCENGVSIYPQSKSDIVGKYCGEDEPRGKYA
jgi:hypothetical protein